MSIYEYNEEEHIRMEREDAFEDGRKAGYESGYESGYAEAWQRAEAEIERLKAELENQRIRNE